MQRQTALAGERGDRSDFLRPVTAAIFGRLGDRNRMRLDLVDVVANGVDGRANGIGRQLGPLALC